MNRLCLLLILWLSFSVWADYEDDGRFILLPGTLLESEPMIIEVDYEEYVANKLEKVTKELQKFDYQYPSYDLFKHKVKYYYGVYLSSQMADWMVDKEEDEDIEFYPNKVISLITEKSGYRRHEPSSIQLITDQEFPVIGPSYDVVDEYLTGLSLYHYNNFIFHDNDDSLVWLTENRADLLIDLVTAFKFYERDDILKVALDKMEFTDVNVLTKLLFDRALDNGDYSLKENILSKIRELKFANQLGDVKDNKIVGQDFYSLFAKILENITQEPFVYINTNNGYQEDRGTFIVASLLNELVLSGIVADVNSFYDKYPFYKNAIEKKNFYNFKNLKNYTTANYKVKEGSCAYYHSLQDDSRACIFSFSGVTHLFQENKESSKVMQDIKNGEIVTVLDTVKDQSVLKTWYLVQTTDGQTGYVYKISENIEIFENNEY